MEQDSVFSSIQFKPIPNELIQKFIPTTQWKSELPQMRKSEIRISSSLIKKNNKFNFEEYVYYSNLIQNFLTQLMKFEIKEVFKKKQQVYISYILTYASMLILNELDKLKCDKQFFRLMIQKDQLMIQKKKKLLEFKNNVQYYCKHQPNQFHFPVKCDQYQDFQAIKPQLRRILNVIYKSISDPNLFKSKSNQYKIRIMIRIVYILIFQKINWKKFGQDLQCFYIWTLSNKIEQNELCQLENYFDKQNRKTLEKDINKLMNKFYKVDETKIQNKS